MQVIKVYVFEAFETNGTTIPAGCVININEEMFIKLKDKVIRADCSCPDCLDKRDTLIRDRLERAAPLQLTDN